MAVRRMIHRNVICSDAFLTLSFEAQALYFQLQIEGDEYGFVGSPMKIMRAVGVSEAALAELIDAGFVHRFDSGVLVLMHWDVANTRQNDRVNAVAFPYEFSLLRRDESRKYILLDSERIPDGFQTDSQRSSAELSGAVAQSSEAVTPKSQKERIASASASSVDGHDDLRDYLFTIPWMNEEAWQSIQSFRRNMDDDLIRFAANQATAHGAESFAYMKKVLYDYLSAKFTTEEEARDREAVFEASKENCRKSQIERG